MNDAAIIVLFAGESEPLHLLLSGASCALYEAVDNCISLTQRCCLAVVALEIKWKAPKAHTLLELVYVRWGKIAHVVSPSPLSCSVACSRELRTNCVLQSVPCDS